MVRKASQRDEEERGGTRRREKERSHETGGRPSRVGDYAKEFHNIRRLKFSHNAGPGSREGQPEGGGGGKEKARRGMRRLRRLGIGPRFLFVLPRTARRTRTAALFNAFSISPFFHPLHLHQDRPSIFRRRVSGRLRYFAPCPSLYCHRSSLLPTTSRQLPSIACASLFLEFLNFNFRQRCQVIYAAATANVPRSFPHQFNLRINRSNQSIRKFRYHPATTITETWREFYLHRKFAMEEIPPGVGRNDRGSGVLTP